MDGLAATDAKSVGTRLQEIAKNATTGGEYSRIGELYGFPILVKTESSIREGMEVKQNRFFVEGEYKYTYNNGQIAMADHKAAATNFLNALDRIPKLMEQYKTKNEAIEKICLRCGKLSVVHGKGRGTQRTEIGTFCY